MLDHDVFCVKRTYIPGMLLLAGDVASNGRRQRAACDTTLQTYCRSLHLFNLSCAPLHGELGVCPGGWGALLFFFVSYMPIHGR